MKTFRKSLLALLFVGTLTFTAQANEISPDKSLSKEIASMMENIVLPEGNGGDDYEAEVKFLVNEDNQIVIVSVDSEESFVESLIKNRLNYQEVKSEEAKPNTINKVKIRLKQP